MPDDKKQSYLAAHLCQRNYQVSPQLRSSTQLPLHVALIKVLIHEHTTLKTSIAQSTNASHSHLLIFTR